MEISMTIAFTLQHSWTSWVLQGIVHFSSIWWILFRSYCKRGQPRSREIVGITIALILSHSWEFKVQVWGQKQSPRLAWWLSLFVAFVWRRNYPPVIHSLGCPWYSNLWVYRCTRENPWSSTDAPQGFRNLISWERQTWGGPSSSESQVPWKNSNSEKFRRTEPTFRSYWRAFGSWDLPNRDGLQGKPSYFSFRSNPLGPTPIYKSKYLHFQSGFTFPIMIRAFLRHIFVFVQFEISSARAIHGGALLGAPRQYQHIVARQVSSSKEHTMLKQACWLWRYLRPNSLQSSRFGRDSPTQGPGAHAHDDPAA